MAVCLEKAEVNGTYPFEAIGLTQEFLESQKREQGSYVFSCLYLNSPVSDEDAVFKSSEFRAYGSIDKEKMYITCTCDPAGEGDDFTALTVVGTDEKMRMYVLWAVNEHFKPDQIIRRIIELNYVFKFDKFGIETNFFKGLLEQQLRFALEYERENKNFKPFGVETFLASAKRGEGKHARILSLQPFHERGDLLFSDKPDNLKGALGELVYQMLQYTQSHRPIHDDLLDSLAYHTKLIRRGDGGGVDALPENCIMSILERQRQESMQSQRNLPRALRRYPEPIFT